MKTLSHPNYPSLPILVAESEGDKAVAGAFFVTVYGKTLSHIASNAYGSGKLSPVLRINKSLYNQQHCIYRRSSSNCSSAKIPGNLAAAQTSWADGAWLSMCNVDRAGTDGLGTLKNTAYQIIWVPPSTGEEPWDLAAPPSTPEVPGLPLPSLPHLPGFGVTAPKTPTAPSPGGGVTQPTAPEEPTTLTKTCDDGSVLSWASGQPEPSCPEAPKKAGFPWWMGLVGVGALVTVIVAAVRNRKVRGRKVRGRKASR